MSNIETFRAKSDSCGNRATVLINHKEQVFLSSETNRGEYGLVVDNLPYKVVRNKAMWCRSKGYTETQSMAKFFNR